MKPITVEKIVLERDMRQHEQAVISSNPDLFQRRRDARHANEDRQHQKKQSREVWQQ